MIIYVYNEYYIYIYVISLYMYSIEYVPGTPSDPSKIDFGLEDDRQSSKSGNTENIRKHHETLYDPGNIVLSFCRVL